MGTRKPTRRPGLWKPDYRLTRGNSVGRMPSSLLSSGFVKPTLERMFQCLKAAKF